jgi:O-antigen ligase
VTLKWIRAATFVSLLIGSLFPALLGRPVTSWAAAGAVVLIVAGVFVPEGSLRAVLPFAAVLVGGLALLAVLGDEPVLPYGDDKLHRLLTLTVLTVLAVSLLRRAEDVRAAAVVWMLACVPLSLGVLAGSDTVAGRASAFDANPIWLARALATGIVVAAWYLWSRHGGQRLLWMGLVVLFAAGLLGSGSRGPAVGAIVGLFSLSAFSPGKRHGRAVALLAVASVATFAMQTMPSLAQSRVVSSLASPDDVVTGSARAEMWKATVPLIAQNPGGVGIGNWSAALRGHFTFMYPHDLWLEVTAELGWLAGLLLVGATVLVLVRLARAAKHSNVASLVLAMLASETVAVSTSGDLNARTFFALLTLGFVVSSWPLRRDEPVGAQDGLELVDLGLQGGQGGARGVGVGREVARRVEH